MPFGYPAIVADERDSKLKGNWEQTKGRIREAWGALTDDELEQSKGSWERLVGTVRERTGETVERVEKRLNDILDKVKEGGSPDEDR